MSQDSTDNKQKEDKQEDKEENEYKGICKSIDFEISQQTICNIRENNDWSNNECSLDPGGQSKEREREECVVKREAISSEVVQRKGDEKEMQNELT